MTPRESGDHRAVGGSFLCPDWELRITERCLVDDLGLRVDQGFDSWRKHEIVEAFVSKRVDRSYDTRDVNGLQHGHQVWVLARGHDHRGATWFDEKNRVVWLLAYRLHRSGQDDDFFPFCRGLGDALYPTVTDYEGLFRDRDHRVAALIRIEAPLALHKAAETPGEERRFKIGGEYGASVAVWHEEDIDATETIVAIRADCPKEYVMAVLAALRGSSNWQPAYKLPSRELAADEIAFSFLRDGS